MKKRYQSDSKYRFLRTRLLPNMYSSRLRGKCTREVRIGRKTHGGGIGTIRARPIYKAGARYRYPRSVINSII
jgi:hypothetical protein